MAALVPLAITAQFFLIGIVLLKNPTAVEAMSRTGDRREILRGPLFYFDNITVPVVSILLGLLIF